MTAGRRRAPRCTGFLPATLGRGARRTLKAASRLPLPTLALAAVRTGRFTLAAARARGTGAAPGAPTLRARPSTVVQVALDECVLAVLNNPSRIPERNELERVGAELEEAVALYTRRGWLDDPAAFHPAPPPLARPGVAPSRWLGVRYERLVFESGYEPHPGEPGRERWLSYEPNRIAYAWVLRHPGDPRPWLVCVHGFGTGRPSMDFLAFRAGFLHRTLGLNLVFPVLPHHGPRSRGLRGGPSLFMSHDLLNVVHGMAQSVWDVRRVLSWVRAQDPVAVGVHGMSLGAYVAALVASLEPGLDCAVAGVPIADLPRLYRHHAPRRLRDRAGVPLYDGSAAAALRVVSALALHPQVAWEGRFLYAGRLDRMATPEQARLLWEHWGQPRITWFDGNHVSFLWSPEVTAFVADALRSSLTDVTPA